MKKRGAKKRYIDIRIYLDTCGTYFEADRMDEIDEIFILNHFSEKIDRIRRENGYNDNILNERIEMNSNIVSWSNRHTNLKQS